MKNGGVRKLKERLTFSNVVAVVALFVALGGASYAAVKIPKNSVGTKQLRKNAVKSSKVKDRSLLAKDFKQGQLPRGPVGPQGERGATGNPGAQGATGERGATGQQGPAGMDGTTGPTGATGETGSAGEMGPTGPTGADGGSDAILAANGPMNPTTNLVGSGQIAMLPLQGTLGSGQSFTSPADFSQTKAVAQSVPRDGNITSISGWFYTDAALALIGTSISLTGSVYVSPGGGSPPAQLPGTQCTATPSLTGIVSIGTISTFSCDGLNVPVTAGSVGFMALEAQVSAGIPGLNSIPVTGSMSISVS